MTYLNHSQDVTSIDREVEKNTNIVKIHSSIFLGIPYICDGFLLWHTSSIKHNMWRECHAKHPPPIWRSNSGAKKPHRALPGNWGATAEKPHRCSWKTFPFLPENPPEKVRGLGGSFRGQAVAAFHVLSWRGKTRQISGAAFSLQDMQTPPGFPIMWLVQCRKPARDSEWWLCCTYGG